MNTSSSSPNMIAHLRTQLAGPRGAAHNKWNTSNCRQPQFLLA